MARLQEYTKKRNFKRTPEPPADSSSTREKGPANNRKLRFVIQKHNASRLHYDFRLENKDGVLKSWAVPKGISLDPSIKRLALMVEDHPGSYIHFEGRIPKGNYGAGEVIVWDTGKYESEEDIDLQLNRGKAKFRLFGDKLNGAFLSGQDQKQTRKSMALDKGRG
jgi:bifunctional non-homologous end joining protein LigD